LSNSLLLYAKMEAELRLNETNKVVILTLAINRSQSGICCLNGYLTNYLQEEVDDDNITAGLPAEAT
jgi:hypothetical protein